MKRHQSLVPLSKEHFDGLRLAQLLKKDAPAYKGLPKNAEEKMIYLIDFFNKNLVKHFEAEEKILFPAIKGIDESLDRLIKNLINEHTLFKNFMNLLDKSVDLSEHLNEIGLLLEKHIRREEREFFEALQAKAPENVLKEIGEKLDAFQKNL
jgi:hemerythrin-like domain-containing protein